jgi:two-component system cell cycle response regulator
MPSETRSTRLALASRVLWAVAAAGIAVHALQAAFGLFGDGADSLIGDVLYDGLLLMAAGLLFIRAPLMGRERHAWQLLGLALVTSAFGDVTWSLLYSGAQVPPSPSFADAFWLASYPLEILAVGMLLKARTPGFSHGGIRIDAAISACAMGAVAAALIFAPVLSVTGGSAATVAANLAYPVGDLVVLVIIVAMFALTDWRPGKGLLMLAAGLLLTAGADSVYLIQTADGSYAPHGLLDTLYPVASLVIAGAVWQVATPRDRAVRDWAHSLFPAIFTILALVLLVYDHFARTNALALALASLTIVLAAGKMLWMLHDSREAHEHSSEQANTDPLTGLANRRALMHDLTQALAAGADAPVRALGLFDLDGFKGYNDALGHPAGDALLERLGCRLRAAMEPYGAAYRIGGDEFCVLISADGVMDELGLAAAAEALTETGSGLSIENSYGSATLPVEAADVSSALQLADMRMYHHKKSRARSVSVTDACEALMRAQRERMPELGAHVRDVAVLAKATALRLGMDEEAVQEVGRAAQLHDIGKVAVPDAILNKPGPLSREETDLMRRHTVVGQRIVGGSPAWTGIGQLIRSSHERVDGSGYPDSLAGDEIPLGARIVAVCDAFDAMVSDRPYRRALSPAHAIAELRKCAGSQFDERVVEEFCVEIDGRAAGEHKRSGSKVQVLTGV